MQTLFRSRLLLLASLAFVPLTSPRLHAAEFGDRLANLSTRAQVGTGENVMISGFVVGDGLPKKILLRAIGPALTGFAVTGALANPVLSLYDARGTLVNTNDDWSPTDAATMSTVGAFALTPGSRDATIVATLMPGAYTAQVAGVAGASRVL